MTDDHAIDRGLADLVGQDPPDKRADHVFVAYPFSLYDRGDYRGVFWDLEDTYKVRFMFADDSLTSVPLAIKIINMMRLCHFGIYELSGSNANVALELGFAVGLREKVVLAFGKQRDKQADVFSDVRGIDRIQWDSFRQLRDDLSSLLGRMGFERRPEVHPSDSSIVDLDAEVIKEIIDRKQVELVEVRYDVVDDGQARESTTARHGSKLELTYRIENKTRYQFRVWLGASLALDHRDFFNVEEDEIVILQRGMTTAKRTLSIQPDWPAGTYKLGALVWRGPKSQSRESKRLTRLWSARLEITDE